MAEKKLMTADAYAKLEEELERLKVTTRKEIAQKIKEAREQGDLSENAEYDAAKDEQRDIEARIEELEHLIKHAEVLSEEEIDKEVVNLGSIVKLYDYEYDEEVSYSIVGSTEANSRKHKISNESPLALALIGHRAGEEVDVETPGGLAKYKVLHVDRMYTE